MVLVEKKVLYILNAKYNYFRHYWLSDGYHKNIALIMVSQD